MSLWWHRLPNFPCQRLHYFYVQTFIKRFAATSISTSNRHYKAVQTRAVCSHQVEDLNSRQKEQIFCYVDALLEWNQDVGQNRDFRETFDVAVARAVAEMRVLAEYCLPLVRVGGLFVAAKGHNPEEEVHDAEKAIRLMGASTIELCHVDSHSPLGQRTAVVCIKNHPTPRKYPREAGVISKTPL